MTAHARQMPAPTRLRPSDARAGLLCPAQHLLLPHVKTRPMSPQAPSAARLACTRWRWRCSKRSAGADPLPLRCNANLPPSAPAPNPSTSRTPLLSLDTLPNEGARCNIEATVPQRPPVPPTRCDWHALLHVASIQSVPECTRRPFRPGKLGKPPLRGVESPHSAVLFGFLGKAYERCSLQYKELSL